MPLYDEESTCPICGTKIANRSTIGFDHLDPPADRICAAFTDCLVHRECLATWEHRDRFVEEWNTLLERSGGSRALVVRPDGFVEYVTPSWLQRVTRAFVRLVRAS